MPPKKTSAPDETPVIPVDTSTLGVRTAEFVDVAPVQVGQAGLSRVVEIRQTTRVEQVVQPVLTLEEAQTLGKQEWKPRPDGTFTCIVDGRRFVVTKEVKEQL